MSSGRLAFKQGSPPTTLGAWRFALDVEQISFSVEERPATWNDTFTHPSADHWLGSNQSFPKLTLRIGVTDALDVGIYYTQNLESNYGWLGLEAKYALLAQRDSAPVSVAVRGAYTKTLYVADMDVHALTADVSVRRTFWKILTPYLAVGADAVLARETSDAVALHDELLVVPHVAGGLEVRYWHLAVGAEAQVSAVTSLQARVSVLF